VITPPKHKCRPLRVLDRLELSVVDVLEWATANAIELGNPVPGRVLVVGRQDVSPQRALTSEDPEELLQFTAVRPERRALELLDEIETSGVDRRRQDMLGMDERS
jgi:hypothetical protein